MIFSICCVIYSVISQLRKKYSFPFSSFLTYCVCFVRVVTMIQCRLCLHFLKSPLSLLPLSSWMVSFVSISRHLFRFQLRYCLLLSLLHPFSIAFIFLSMSCYLRCICSSSRIHILVVSYNSLASFSLSQMMTTPIFFPLL